MEGTGFAGVEEGPSLVFSRFEPRAGVRFTDRYGRPDPYRVLLAEDDAALRELLVELLRSRGYEVAEATNGHGLADRLASAMLENRIVGVDLIVTDHWMPGWTGLDALESLRQQGWKLPVILITAFGDEALHAEARRRGASAVLDKPFELEELLWWVEELLHHPPGAGADEEE